MGAGALLAGSAANGGIGSLGAAATAVPDPRIATVVSVPDGERLDVRFLSGAERTLRYIGVAAPACGERFLTLANRSDVAPGDRVRVAYAARRHDSSGELRAYVSHVPSGEVVNATLMAAAAPRQGAWARC